MKESTCPRLCGGTFFTLVLQGLKQRTKAREHYRGERDGLSDPEVLVGLIRVINPDYNAPELNIIKSKTNEYKSCSTSTGKYFPFGNTAEMSEFARRIQTNYSSALEAMTEFVYEFLEIDTASKRDMRLAAALIELVIDDDSIEPDEEFFVVEDGSKIKKATFSDLNEVCLPALLLGIWHYAVTKRKDNKVGKQTYDNWCPPAGGGPRVYQGDIGERVRSNISRVFVPTRNLHTGHASKNSEKTIQNTLDESKKTFTAYIEKATERYNVMRLIGGKEVSLKDFFVCNTIGEKERVFADKKKIKCLYLDNPRMNTIRNMYLKQRGYDNKRTLLIGSGGCGKSLMLQHLFLEAAEDYTTTGILPIFLELRYFTQETEMLQFIVETVSSKDESFTSEEAEKALYEGRCQLLMDGFDEIDPSDIDSFLKKINSFLDRYQNVQVIITSRENEYLTGLNQFVHLYVWPFDTEQSMQLIDRILTYQNQPDERDAIVDYIGKGFLKKDGIFASNPLLLTYVSMLYPNYRRFNENHQLFYKLTYEALLSGHDDNKKPYDRVFKSVDDASQFSKVFEQFCALSYQEGVLEFDANTFEKYFNLITVHKEFENPHKMNIKNFKHDVCSTACMMYEQECDVFYIDPGFQEYLFSEYYVKADIPDMDQLLNSLKNLPYKKLLKLDALEMLYSQCEDKFKEYLLIPFLSSVFTKKDTDAFERFLGQYFDEVYICVHDKKQEVSTSAIYDVEKVIYSDVENYPSSVLMNFVLKMVGEHIDYSFALHSSLVESIPENTEETGKLIATVKEIERKKIIQIENKASDLYEAIRISHKQGYDHSWITDTDQNLICFGKTVKVDSYDLCESPESFMEIANDIARQSNNTYNVFLNIENYYKQLKREQHRRRR